MKYKLLKEIVEKLEQYEASHEDKNQISLQGFASFITVNNKKELESKHLESGDNSGIVKGEFGEIDPMSSTLEIVIGQNIIFLYRYAKQYTKKALKDSELRTADEFTYLATLLNYTKLSKIELINKSVQEKTTGMETIKRLLKNNLIEQFDNPDDNRSQLIQLTEKGRGVLFGVFHNMDLVSKIIVGNLTENEKIQLALLLKKLDNYHHDIHTNKKGLGLEFLVYDGDEN